MPKALFVPLQLSVGTVACLYTSPLLAQVTTDGTVNTQVNQNGNVAEITGGETRDSNLFHSFQDFSVPTGNEAFFNNAESINNIFSRVTGGNISNIDGAIRANGNASLFLINPAGIIFGENASLDLGGSFYGSTASSILFEDGAFSAANLDNSPLLTVNAPIGLGFRDNPGDIENNSVVNDSGLEVNTGESLGLIGGEINLNAGKLTAPEGNIQLGSLAKAGIVSFQESSEGINLVYESTGDFGDIQFSNGALVNVDGQQGGTVHLQGNVISLLDNSQISSTTFGSEAGNDITLSTQKLLIQDNSRIVSTTLGEGEGGNININASDSVELIGTGFEEFQQNFILAGLNGTVNLSTPGTGLLTGTASSGQSGEININTSNLSLQDGAYIFSPTFGEGNGGNINVEANQIDIVGSSIASIALIGSSGDVGNTTINTDNLVVSDGSNILGVTFGSGNAGDIFINASESLELLRTPEGVFVQTGIFPSNIGGTGNSGNAIINTSRLIIQDGAGIASVSGGIFGGTVFSRIGGEAGNISINASELVEISGISEPLADGTRIGSFISGQTTTNNSAGQLTIDTGKLIIKDGGLISAATLDAGDAGELTINASESIEISGSSLNGQFPSTIEASSGRAFSIDDSSASGNAGDLNISTGQLTVSDGGLITANTLGEGVGGNVNISVLDSIVLENNGSILAETTFTAGGNINLEIGEILSLSDNSLLSAQAFNQANGGNLSIDSKFVIAFPSSNNGNDIIADAEQGQGGNISINAESLLGIDEGVAVAGNETNDIDASSQFSLDGSVTVNTPDINPIQGTTELPTNIVVPEQTTAQACEANREVAARNGLTISGRVGIAPEPGLPLNSLNVTVNGESNLTSSISEPIETAQGKIQPARGVKATESGEIILTAYRTNNAGERLSAIKGNCDRV